MMILQGARRQKPYIGVCYANDPPKGGYTTLPPALDLTSLQGDFLVEKTFSGQNLCPGANIHCCTQGRARHRSPFLQLPRPSLRRLSVPPTPPRSTAHPRCGAPPPSNGPSAATPLNIDRLGPEKVFGCGSRTGTQLEGGGGNTHRKKTDAKHTRRPGKGAYTNPWEGHRAQGREN